jgi:hypothetical protein
MSANVVGANAMRYFLIVALLSNLDASASSATVRHSGHPVIVRASQSWAYIASRQRYDYNDAPSYDDPLKFGGEAALPAAR